MIPRTKYMDMVQVVAYIGDRLADCDGRVRRHDGTFGEPGDVEPACVTFKAIPTAAATAHDRRGSR